MKASYFQDELTYLRESGRLFSERNPRLSKYLSDASTDPDVERLLEGFAFLTSRLREKLDDELPELTHSLVQLLIPNFLRAFPSTTLMQMVPVEKAITERQVLPAGSQILSRPVDEIVCPFQTTADVTVYPLDIVEQDVQRSRESTVLTLKFQTLSGLPLSRLSFRDLRLWIAGDEVAAQMLYLWLGRYLKDISVCFDSKEAEDGEVTRYKLPISALQPGSFGGSEALLPNENSAYEGYRLLQEYFVFPAKFQCYDIDGLEPFFRNREETDFSLELTFSRPLPPEVKVRPGTFRLYCVPAVNLFAYDAEPMKIDHSQMRYPIRPTANGRGAIDIFSIDRIMSWRAAKDPSSGSHLREYPSFESFHHEVERADGLTQIYYRLRLREALGKRGMEHLVSFVRHDNERAIPEHEVLSADLKCFHPNHAMELGAGDVCEPTGETPSFVTFKNLGQPTAPVYPPLDGSLYWNLISNLSLNYVSLLEKEALKTVIATYDFQARLNRQDERVSKQRIDGIVSIETKPVDKLFRGQAVRGLKTVMSLNEEAFQSEGEMFLFCSVLAEFFSLYSSVNSFHELIVNGTQNNEVYQWPAKIGRQPLI
ncbi:type VI secretion system baseplate subunit TssF [Pseudovibrio brasiliensis]|uniref:Type VI secretion system baseplate subunit TssF n=1 Tax=Pseudovibrio brasiliensis TaxID=1898042 RepID=A0ABX8AR32_9HYPH|nr:type VI secretion system baseplate subunit TssF [Pseudovibrio brasiliensis]QUS57132.1 type VI secretion system baseplate subunit TssF [Pseudovibrio brasiliensis]